MADESNESFADRIARESEDAVARLVQELGEHPLMRTLLERAFGARERAAQAQEVALAALNIPSASDIERLTRRIRSVSLRMEGLEDGVDRLDERLAALVANGDLDARLSAIEQQLERIAGAVATLAESRPPVAQPAKAARRAASKPAAKKPAARKPAATPARARRQPSGPGARQR
ncbi:MAG TPA: hypothetical protein VFB41_06010 [Solirubrobacteraceae bacterium]|nr:hypothetical protein [Solirubrobacteraceae bacterium]